jgi:hypothetical protein
MANIAWCSISQLVSLGPVAAAGLFQGVREGIPRAKGILITLQQVFLLQLALGVFSYSLSLFLL